MVRTPCCDKAIVNTGLWTPEEDALLKDYIEKHGTECKWVNLPRRAGLKRCGKSCRLRWLNYLKPDLKHGDFSEEEESIICQLYEKMGTKWSAIASHLPGRTDNKIKNHWNTRLKKKYMASVNNEQNNMNINPSLQSFSQSLKQAPDFWNQSNYYQQKFPSLYSTDYHSPSINMVNTVSLAPLPETLPFNSSHESLVHHYNPLIITENPSTFGLTYVHDVSDPFQALSSGTSEGSLMSLVTGKPHYSSSSNTTIQHGLSFGKNSGSLMQLEHGLMGGANMSCGNALAGLQQELMSSGSRSMNLITEDHHNMVTAGRPQSQPSSSNTTMHHSSFTNNFNHTMQLEHGLMGGVNNSPLVQSSNTTTMHHTSLENNLNPVMQLEHGLLGGVNTYPLKQSSYDNLDELWPVVSNNIKKSYSGLNDGKMSNNEGAGMY